MRSEQKSVCRAMLCGLFLLVWAGTVWTAGGGKGAGRTYVNPRFGFSVVEPGEGLVAQPDSENGDGRVWLSPDGQVEVRVWGSLNALDESLEGAAKEAEAGLVDGLPPLRVTMRVRKPGWFALSGFQGETVVYRKTFLRSGVFFSIRFFYPRALASRYDTLVSRVVPTFRPPGN